DLPLRRDASVASAPCPVCTFCAPAVIVSCSTLLARSTRGPAPGDAIRCIIAVLAAAMLAGCSQPLQPRLAADRRAADSVRYEIVDLGTLEPSACSHPGECRATAINARGQVV